MSLCEAETEIGRQIERRTVAAWQAESDRLIEAEASTEWETATVNLADTEKKKDEQTERYRKKTK